MTGKSIFYFPGILSILVGIYVLITMKDTPQSCGLPSIEEHTGEYPPDEKSKKIANANFQ